MDTERKGGMGTDLFTPPKAGAAAVPDLPAHGETGAGGYVPDLLTHNGYLTARSARTGEHRTFRLETQAPDARFAPGKRTVSLLTGPNNTEDYTGFGFIESAGDPRYPAVRIRVWAKKRGTPDAPSQYELLARYLENLPAAARRGDEFNLDGRCRVCNRPLTTPESVRDGIGPVCAGR